MDPSFSAKGKWLKSGATLPGTITLVLLAGMLCAGLWPFSFNGNNNVAFSENNGGLVFSSPAAACDIDTITSREKSFLADSEITIGLRLSASGHSLGRGAWIVSVLEGKRQHLLVGQWKSHLFVKTDRFLPNGIRKGECAARDALPSGKTQNIAIVTGPRGSRIYVNGILACQDNARRIFFDKNRGRQRFALCGAINGKYTFNGTLFRFSIAKGDASGGGVSRADDAIIDFECVKNDSIFRNGAGSRHALVVPAKFPLAPAIALAPPWDDFSNEPAYYSDLIVNLAGFVPFGFFLSAFLMHFRSMTGRKAFAVSVATGFLFSLGIELAQVYLPFRSSQMSDLILNTAGTLVGTLIWFYRSRNGRKAAVK
jgi:VanZ family protein